MENSPKYLKACTAFDAYCQAIESYWAVKSTPISRKYARKAIEICRDNIVNYINTNDSIYAGKMAQASNLAGKAINISRTTAAHAMSYSITSKYGIPHGHAVALNIGKLMEYNKKIDIETLNDQRGLEFVRNRINEIYELINIDNGIEYFQSLFKLFDINYEEYPIEYIDPNRLENNPRIINIKKFKEQYI